MVLGCGLRRKPLQPEPVRGPTRDSVFALDDTRTDSLNARGPVDGMLALLGRDVVYLRAGIPAIYGREAARAMFIASAGASGGPHNWQALGGDVSRDLRSAYTYGVAARLAQPPAIRLERYIAFWQRERGEPWRILAYAEINGVQAVETSFSAVNLAPSWRTPSRELAEIAARVRATDSLFSDLADRVGTALAFSSYVAPSGVVFGPSQLVVGPRAVEEFFRSQPAGTSLTWAPRYASVAGSGDLGFTVGDYISTGRGASGAAVQRFGKYLTVWQRQADGSWKFVVDGGNPTPARSER